MPSTPATRPARYRAGGAPARSALPMPSERASSGLDSVRNWPFCQRITPSVGLARYTTPARQGSGRSCGRARSSRAGLPTCCPVSRKLAAPSLLSYRRPLTRSAAYQRCASTRSATTTAVSGKPCTRCQRLPKSPVRHTPPWSGTHTTCDASAAMAMVPAPCPRGGSLANAAQCVPPSCEYSARISLLRRSRTVPLRTTHCGAWPAPSMLSPLVRRGPRYCNCAVSNASCRKPSISPSALSRCAPAIGLSRSSGTVSSSPRSWNHHCSGCCSENVCRLREAQMP